MKKRIIPLLLAAVLAVGSLPALAAEERFPATKDYPGYADVKEGDWFYANAKLCYEIGFMTGTDKGFEPGKTLTVAECATVAARVREALTGEGIPDPTPNNPWYQHYVDYLKDAMAQTGAAFSREAAILSDGTASISRLEFLLLLNVALYGQDVLSPVNTISTLPDTDDGAVLTFYNAGILTGIDDYGTCAGERTLTRAECAAMVARIARPELRKRFVPKDYAPFAAAHLAPSDVLFQTGATAEAFLTQVNSQILRWESFCADQGLDFNWHLDTGDGTILERVKADTLTALGVTADMGSPAYQNFDVQVYYARLIDRLGAPLGGKTRAVTAQAETQNYTLTPVTLPEGWAPTADLNAVAAGWAAIERRDEDGWTIETAIYRAADGAILPLDGYYIYSGNAISSLRDATRVRVLTGPEDCRFWNVYDVEQGKLLLEQPLPDESGVFDSLDRLFPTSPRPRVAEDEATGLLGLKDEAGNWLIPPRYTELYSLGDGIFTYWGEDWSKDCGIVTQDGTETPTTTFSGYFNGGLGANHGLIAMYHEGTMAYYDYAGKQVSEHFDWAGPIGDDGAGFVRLYGTLFRIQFDH